MGENFEKKLGWTELEWGFVTIPSDRLDFFGEGSEFTVKYLGRSRRLRVSKAHRIGLRRFLRDIHAKEGDTIVFVREGPKEFSLSKK